MTIFFKLAQELLIKDLNTYIEESQREDQSLVQTALCRKLELSSEKRLLARSVIDAINRIESKHDSDIQKQLDTLLRVCKEHALDKNLKHGGSEGRLEALIDNSRDWLERLLKKINDNHLMNIPDNKHPFSIFCQKMVKYFDHKIHEELTEWRLSHTARQAFGFTTMPLEKAAIIHQAIVDCMKKMYRLDGNKDYSEGIRDVMISVLKELLTGNSGISSNHAVAISAPLPLLWGLFGTLRLPLGSAQPSDGFLKTCITEAHQEISALSKSDLQDIVTNTMDEFQAMFEAMAQETQAQEQGVNIK